MRLKFSGSIPEDKRGILTDLIHEGFRGIGHTGVEIHVKAKSSDRWQKLERRAWKRNGGKHTTLSEDQAMARAAEEDRRHSHQFTGRAYSGLDDGDRRGDGYLRVAATTKHLITLNIPPDLDAVVYPRQRKYRRLKTAPVIHLESWREEFVYLVSHEAYHISQHRRRGGKQSEIRCEKWALSAVERYRADAGARQ